MEEQRSFLKEKSELQNKLYDVQRRLEEQRSFLKEKIIGNPLIYVFPEQLQIYPR